MSGSTSIGLGNTETKYDFVSVQITNLRRIIYMTSKASALRQYLSQHNGEEISEHRGYYSTGDDDYLVLTEKEALKHARREAADTLYALPAAIVARFCEREIPLEAVECCQGLGEVANEALHAFVGDNFGALVNALDRGELLASDGVEGKVSIDGETFLIYRG